jgi:riboflavin-specific deaminase-like protein
MRPFVRVNMAMTADGKVATASRSIHTFGSPRDARHLYELRAGADAILCGARTVEETRATLGSGGPRFEALRHRNQRAPQALRVVVSGSASLSSDAALWEKRFSPILVWTSASAPSDQIARLRSLADDVWTSPGPDIDFRAALDSLARSHGVRDVIVEGGGALNDALFRAGVVDELHLTWCPRIFGGRAAPTLADGIGVPHLGDAARFQLKSIRRHADELFLVFNVSGAERK